MVLLIFDKFVKLFRCLEDPRYPSVGPQLRLLSYLGIWYKETNRFKLFIYFFIMGFFISQYVKCFVNYSSEAVKLILQYAPWHLGVVKTYYFLKDHSAFEDIITYISTLERNQLERKEEKIDKIISEYIFRNRFLTYLFYCMSFVNNIGIYSEPYRKIDIIVNGTSTYYYIFDGYTPFKREPPGVYVAMAIQTFAGYTISAYILTWDTLVMALLISFAGQIKIARTVYCKLLIEDDTERSHQNIAEFHRYYLNMIKYQEMFNSILMPVMFVYLIVVSINLGVSIMHLVTIQNDLTTLMSNSLYIFAMLFQLLFFYWHSNEVSLESTLLSYGIFESNWPTSDLRLQKEIALLIITTQKRLVFTAGPFNEMSLSTFVGILRASYSFYTLLK